MKNHWPDHSVDQPDAYFLSQEFTCNEEIYVLPDSYSVESEGILINQM